MLPVQGDRSMGWGAEIAHEQILSFPDIYKASVVQLMTWQWSQPFLMRKSKAIIILEWLLYVGVVPH